MSPVQPNTLILNWDRLRLQAEGRLPWALLEVFSATSFLWGAEHLSDSHSLRNNDAHTSNCPFLL